VIALDARIVVNHPKKGQERAARFAIRPYPVELEGEIEHGGERLRIRPIRPDDEPMLQAFTRRLTPEDVRMRFFGPMRELSHEFAARLTQIDYDREMAFVLLDGKEMVGVGRLVADPDFQQGEFALTVASDRQGRGYGELLLRHVLQYGKARGMKRVIGHVLRENSRMLELAKQVGFRRESGRSGEPDIRVVKSLASL
jgi:acetyltransferase